MKEQTYGWYPSARNVYEDRKMVSMTPYEMEALYRYQDSKYYQPPSIPEEEKRQNQRPSSSVSRASSKSSKMSDSKRKSDLHVRATSVPINTCYKPPPRLNLPTPQQCWSTHVPETEMTAYTSCPSPSKTSIQLKHKATPCNVHMQNADRIQESAALVTSPKHITETQKTVRIQSATVRRDTPMQLQRHVKSAGPNRPSPIHSSQCLPTPPDTQPPMPSNFSWPQPDFTEEKYAPGKIIISSRPPSEKTYVPIPPPTNFEWPYPSEFYDDSSKKQIQFSERLLSGKISPARPSVPTPTACDRMYTAKLTSLAEKPPSGQKLLRPKAPSPAKMQLHMDEDERYEALDYDEMVKKHGWMMEIHGDPLKLKKLSQRLPYTVKIQEPEIEPEPPKTHMENLETFFLNTIPRRPMTFAIDKEWISEVIHNKRMERQKKHGINYRYKNFSFVY